MDKLKFTKEKKPNATIYISTTGNAMISKYHEDILKYVDILKFSIYGTTPEVYKLAMGGLSFEKSMKLISEFLFCLIDSVYLDHT